MGVYLQQIAITIFLIIIVSIVKINFAQLVSDGNIIANINGDSDALPSLSNYITQDNDHLAGGNIVASIHGISNSTRITSNIGGGSHSHRGPLTHVIGTGNVVAAINGKTRPPKKSVAKLSKQVNSKKSETPSSHELKKEKPNQPKHHHAKKASRKTGKKHKAKHKGKHSGHHKRGKYLFI